jgi:fumarate reductase subunit D
MPPNDKFQTDTMRWILFGVILVLFIVIVVFTILAIFFNYGNLSPENEKILVRVFIVEIGVAIITLFYAIFGLKRKDKGIHKIRLIFEEMLDVRHFFGKQVTCTPYKSSGEALDPILSRVYNENGPCISIELPAETHNVFLSIDLDSHAYSGSFSVDSFLVDITKEE